MGYWTNIQWKALLMLVAFTASFTVFCHCEPAPACHRSCCEKKAPVPSPSHGCQGMNAVKLNLQAKQAATVIQVGVVPMMVIGRGTTVCVVMVRKWLAETNKYSPPDKQSLLQCFRI